MSIASIIGRDLVFFIYSEIQSGMMWTQMKKGARLPGILISIGVHVHGRDVIVF